MTASQPTILVIEDETPIRHFIQTTLSGAGYRVVDAETGKEGLTQAMAWNPDVVLLDLGLPDIDGLEVIRRLREWTSKPIIVLTARSQEHDKVTALDLGADDYLTKPFGIEELLARMRVALRRTARTEAGSRFSRSAISGSILKSAGSLSPAKRSISVRRNTSYWVFWCAMPERSSRIASCSRRCGGRCTRRKRNI